MKRILLAAFVSALVLAFIGCGDEANSPVSPMTSNPSGTLVATNGPGSVSDPLGDATDDPRTDPDPDLLSAMITCDGVHVMFEVHLDAATFMPEGAYVGFGLDADQDPSTGFDGIDLAHNDSGIIGLEFVLYVGDLGPSAELLEFIAPPNTFATVGTYPVTVLPDGYQVMVPVGDFGGDDGAMNYKLTAQAVIDPGAWTGVLDYMPDVGLPPGSTEPCPGLAMVDIKPGSDPNSVNCRNENALIPVALLGSDVFDVSMVDHTTVTFEGATEIHVDKKTGLPRRHMEDVNYDGYMDLVFHFLLVDTDLDCESTMGWLQGMFHDGTMFEGSDAIRMVDKMADEIMP